MSSNGSIEENSPLLLPGQDVAAAGQLPGFNSGMSLEGGSGGQSYTFPVGSGRVSGQPPPEEFQPNAGPPVTVPAPQQGGNSMGHSH